MEDKVMLECVVEHGKAKDVFEFFRENKLAIEPQISLKDESNDAIVCMFKNANTRQTFVGRLVKTFPDTEMSFR